MPKIYFEWVVRSGSETYYLTEEQHKILLENQDNRFVAFREFTINPAFVSSIYKQPLKELKQLYPCQVCHSNGYKVISSTETEECSECKGSGVRP